MNDEEKKFLLELSRKTIEYFVRENKTYVHDGNIPYTILNQKRATFVSLHKNNDLRGCVGHLAPQQELYKDVIQNSINACNDERFPPVREEELSEIKIEISVLSVPQRLEYKDTSDLLNKLNPKQGLILKKGFAYATLLPQVWEQLPEKKEFLGHLCMKAGLQPDEWKTAEIQTYEAEVFGEE